MKILLSLALFLVGSCFAASEDAASYFSGENNAAYLSWLEESSKYDTSIFMESNTVNGQGVGVFWSINQDEETIQLAVAAQTTGWAAFGIAEAGGMRGADMVVFESATKDIFDAHVLDDIEKGPIRDECQNWELTNQLVDGGFIIFEAKRLLDTGDAFDRAIINDSSLMVPAHRVIAAWGDTEKVSYHGPDNRARSTIRFFATEADEEEAFQKAMAAEAEGDFELRAIDYPIKQVGTEYAYFCFTNKDLIARDMPAYTPLHMIGVEPLVDMDAKAHVHHFILYASALTYDDADFTTQEQCREGLEAFEQAYTWAPGAPPLFLPSNVGGPLGLGGFQSFKLEIHYDNPSLVSGVLDSSGVKMYYTSKKREHDLGILQIGDPFISLFNQTVGDGLVSHTFDCPGECSKFVIPTTEKLQVIGEYMHMHATGKRMYNEQFRDGELIRTGVVDYYDFDQNGGPPVQQETFEIWPGDAFRTRCYFDSNDGEVWGLASQDEMCIAFLYYYPRQTTYDGEWIYVCGLDVGIDECQVAYKSDSLASTDELDRSFGSGNGECKASSTTTNTSSAVASKTAALSALFAAFALFAIQLFGV